MDITKLANLARIKLSKVEEEELTKEFPAILAFVDQINSIDFDSEPGGEGNNIEDNSNLNVFRKDENPNQKGAMTEKLLSEAPGREGNFVKVKKIL